jgi:glycerophosphoryl diester phosphodiesterase
MSRHLRSVNSRDLRLRDGCGDLTEQEIPTLDEVFTLVDGCRSQLRESLLDPQRAEQFVVNVEIKGSGIASHVGKAIEGRLGTSWKYRHGLVSSFDMGTIEELRNLNPNIPVGVLLEGPVENPREPWDIQLEELEQCLARSINFHPEAVNITLPSLTNDAAEVIRASGALPVAWTWNEAPPDTLRDQSRCAIAEHIRKNDITLITDYPAEMIELLTSHY